MREHSISKEGVILFSPHYGNDGFAHENRAQNTWLTAATASRGRQGTLSDEVLLEDLSGSQGVFFAPWSLSEPMRWPHVRHMVAS